MKKLMFLSIVVSALMFAGSAVAADEPEEKEKAKPAWDFKGQALIYYQTADGYRGGSLFDQGPPSLTSGWARGAGGIQFSGTNKDVVGGVGAGFELSGISTIGMHNSIVFAPPQNAGGNTGGAITQGYLTYGLSNTSIKVFRQTLPKSLSPFAFSEGWNMFKNSFDAGLVVNSSVPDTTLVYAYVARRNNSVGDLNDFNKFYGSDAAHMITAQNKSIEGLTLTGSYYYLPDATDAGNADALWFDVGYKADQVSLAFQIGSIGGAAVPEDNDAWGAKIAGKLGPVNVSLAYSSVGDGSLRVANLAGAGVKTPLYTQAVLNQNAIKMDSDSFKLAGSMKGLGGTFVAAYANSDLGPSALGSVFGLGVGGEGTYEEYELIYQRPVGKHIKTFTAFIIQKDDRQAFGSQNFFRFWIRYDF